MMQIFRPRRLRQNVAIRAIVQENRLSPADFIAPLFIIEGQGIKEEISSMPGYFRYSLDRLEDELSELVHLGIKAVLLFVKVPDTRKDNQGTEALNPDGLMQRAVKFIRSRFAELLIMTDVALDPYSAYGHDGVVEDGEIVNDKTVEILAEMALSHAQAGAHFVAPSDMMDGRIGAIRKRLEEAEYPKTGIMAYSAKYASSFYGPFRDALDSAPGFGDKKTYQMNPANNKEALREALLDQAEGADILMVKPGLPYLDIVYQLQQATDLPISVYQVSGEYAMIRAAVAQNYLEEKSAILESLIAFKRAGASLIATYFAKEAARYLIQN
ncbi:MAG: porphobilinogen synthase [Bacteroidota bacterium]